MTSLEGIGSLKLPLENTCESSIAQNFDYYSPVQLEDAQESFFEEKVLPTNGLSLEPYEFVFESMGDSFLSLNSLYLHVEGNICKEDGTKVDVDEDVAPINYLVTTMWKNIETKINDTTLNPSTAYNIPYKAQLDACLSIEDSLSSFPYAGGFYLDTAGKYDLNNNTNNGWENRRRMLCNKNGFSIAGQICNDFLQSDNHLAPGNRLTLKFIRAPDEFCLLTNSNEKYKIKITDIGIYARRIKLFPKAFPKVLNFYQNQRYLAPYTEMKEYPLSTGLTQWNAKITSGGALPKHAVVAFVETDAHVGNYKLNPFNFQNFDLNRINFKVNGMRVPQEPLRPNFEKKIFMKEFNNVFMNTGKFRVNSGNCVSKESFSENGMCVFPFDFSPDQCNMFHMHVGKDGILELEIEWAKALTKNITVLVYLSMHQVIQLKGEGSVPLVSLF